MEYWINGMMNGLPKVFISFWTLQHTKISIFQHSIIPFVPNYNTQAREL